MIKSWNDKKWHLEKAWKGYKRKSKSSKIPLLSSRAINSDQVEDSDTDLESVTSDTLLAGCLTFRQCCEMYASSSSYHKVNSLFFKVLLYNCPSIFHKTYKFLISKNTDSRFFKAYQFSNFDEWSFLNFKNMVNLITWKISDFNFF